MVLQRLKELEEPLPEQPFPIVRVCWDELFRFLRDLFKPRKTRAWSALGNLDAETSTEYKTVFVETVPSDFEGILNEISLYSSRPDTTQWALVIIEEVQFINKKIYTSLSLPFRGVTVNTLQKITLKAKTDGVATNIAGSLTGQLHYLGGK